MCNRCAHRFQERLPEGPGANHCLWDLTSPSPQTSRCCPVFLSACFYHGFNLDRHLGASYAVCCVTLLCPGIGGRQANDSQCSCPAANGKHLVFKSPDFLLWQGTKVGLQPQGGLCAGCTVSSISVSVEPSTIREAILGLQANPASLCKPFT